MTDVWELVDLWAGRFVTRSLTGRKEALAEIFTEQLEARNKAVEDALAAFKQEVSDALVEFCDCWTMGVPSALARFIIAKPDPLAVALKEADSKTTSDDREYTAMAVELRQALAARGLKIVEQDQ